MISSCKSVEWSAGWHVSSTSSVYKYTCNVCPGCCGWEEAVSLSAGPLAWPPIRNGNNQNHQSFSTCHMYSHETSSVCVYFFFESKRGTSKAAIFCFVTSSTVLTTFLGSARCVSFFQVQVGTYMPFLCQC